jgi:hypothetical protein
MDLGGRAATPFDLGREHTEGHPLVGTAISLCLGDLVNKHNLLRGLLPR